MLGKLKFLLLFKMAEISMGLQFGVRKTIVGHKSLIWYQYTRFPRVNVGIGDLFP